MDWDQAFTTDHLSRVLLPMPDRVEPGVSGNPAGQARRCLSETQAKGDLTSESASQTRRAGGRGPPSQEGQHLGMVLTSKVHA
jgi:hypothetical protein